MPQNETTTYLKLDDKQMRRALKSSQQNVQDYARLVKGAILGIGSAFLVQKAVQFGRSFVQARKEQVQAETRLGAVIEATGKAAGFSLDQMKALASEVQVLTGVGDETVLTWQAVLATFKNIKGDHFREATLLAGDMAEALGGDAKSAALQLGKALNDPVVGVTALTRSGIQFTEQQKEQIKTLVESGDVMKAQRVILDELQGQLGGTAQKVFEQVGAFDGLWGRIGDLTESFGQLLIPVVEATLPVFQTAVEYTERLTSVLLGAEGSAKEFSDGWGQAIDEGFKYGLEIMVDSFSVMEFLFTNWTTIIDRQVNQGLLSLVSFWEEVKHLFTEVGPTYIQWFADNFITIMLDVQIAQNTILENMVKNFQEFFTFVTDWLSGKNASFEFTGLLEGFETSVSKLPEIAERRLSDTEKGLQQYISGLDKELGNSFAEITEKNSAFLNKIKNPGEGAKIDLTPELSEESVKKMEEKAQEILGLPQDEALKARDGLIKTMKDREALLRKEQTVSAEGDVTSLTGLNASVASASADRLERALEIQNMAQLDAIAMQIQFLEDQKSADEKVLNEMGVAKQQRDAQKAAIEKQTSELVGALNGVGLR